MDFLFLLHSGTLLVINGETEEQVLEIEDDDDSEKRQKHLVHEFRQSTYHNR